MKQAILVWSFRQNIFPGCYPEKTSKIGRAVDIVCGPTLSVAILHPSGFMLGTRWILVLDTSCCTSLSPACSGEQWYLVMRKSYERVISAHLIFLFFAPSYFF